MSVLDNLRKVVAVPATKLRIDDLVPVLVPASFAESGKWPGPILTLEVPGLAATWGVLLPKATVRWVTTDMTDRWEAAGIDWRLRSMENLERISDPLAPQTMLRADGTLLGLLLNHDDSLGPSRLLLNGAIEGLFPEGYQCAIPDRTFAVVVSNRVTAAERKRVKAFVAESYNRANEPFIRELFHPDLLQAKEGI